MVNTINSKGQLIRWESYEKDKENLIVSKWQDHYCVVNIGKKTRTKKKEIAIRSYKVWKDGAGDVHCTCPRHAEHEEICKHMLKVNEVCKGKKKLEETRQTEARQQEEQERAERVQRAIARW